MIKNCFVFRSVLCFGDKPLRFSRAFFKKGDKTKTIPKVSTSDDVISAAHTQTNSLLNSCFNYNFHLPILYTNKYMFRHSH